MENLFGIGSMLCLLLSAFYFFLSGDSEGDAKAYRATAVYYILVAIFCRIGILTYQMITIAELLQ